MHFLKLVLMGLFPLIFSSMMHESQYESLQKTTQFFDHFEASAIEKLNQLAAEMSANVPELEAMHDKVVSFPETARTNLFMRILKSSCEEALIFEEFTVLYAVVLANPFDQIQRASASKGHLITAHANKYNSDFKNIMFSCIEKSIEAIKNPAYLKPVPVVEAAFFEEFFDSEDDEIFSKIANATPVKKFEYDDDSDNLIRLNQFDNSNRSISPMQITNLEMKAKCQLLYGIKTVDTLFPVAYYYLRFAIQNQLENYDPSQLLYSNSKSELAKSYGLAINSPDFQEFCKHVNSTKIPITSPLYAGPRKTNDEKLNIKHEVLFNLAREEAFEIVRNLNVEAITNQVMSETQCIDIDVAEFIIGEIKGKINEYLLALDIKGSFVVGLELAIKEGCLLGTEMFGLSEDEISIIMYDTFIVHFENPLALLKKSDSIAIWKNFYDESSPNFKSKSRSSSVSDVTDSPVKSSGRKSVTIDENSNECFILSRENIFGPVDDDDEHAGKPLRRTASFSHGLNLTESGSEKSLRRINSSLIHPTPVTRPAYHFNRVSASSFDAFSAISEQSSAEQIQYSRNEVPYFPFENPVAAIEDPLYVKSTGIYALQNGDDACFSLDERLYSIQKGLEYFLGENFKNSEVIESIESLFAESLDSIFKS